MSYSIDYQRKAYRYKDRYGEECFVVLVERGDNNVWESNNRRRARHWRVTAHGARWDVYQRITEYCSCIAGGSLRLVNVRRSGDYARDIMAGIRKYDRALKAAVPLEMIFREHALRAETMVGGNGKSLEKYAADKLDAYLMKYGLRLDIGSDYGKSVWKADSALTTTEHLLDSLEGERGWGDPSIRVRVQVV